MLHLTKCPGEGEAHWVPSRVGYALACSSKACSSRFLNVHDSKPNILSFRCHDKFQNRGVPFALRFHGNNYLNLVFPL